MSFLTPIFLVFDPRSPAKDQSHWLGLFTGEKGMKRLSKKILTRFQNIFDIDQFFIGKNGLPPVLTD